MAATFVVEDGTGLANANSYVSEADADQYHEDHLNPSVWTAADSATKQQALRLATQFLDQTYLSRWKGIRILNTQALDFPRDGVFTEDGYLLLNNEVPQQLIDATCEMAAAWLADTASALIPTVTTPGDFKRVEVGPIEVEFLSSGGSQVADYAMSDALVADLIESGSEIRRA